MTLSGEMVYYIGLAFAGFAAVAAAIAVPVFLLTEKKLKKQLELEYGKDLSKSAEG